MSKKNEVIHAVDTVIEKGDIFLGKAKDFISYIEILLVAATGLKAILEKYDGGEAMSKMSNLDFVPDEMITAGQKMIDAATALGLSQSLCLPTTNDFKAQSPSTLPTHSHTKYH